MLGHLEHKGMYTVAKWDNEDKMYYGTFRNEGDIVDFMSPTYNGFLKEFHRAVDEYYQHCHDIGKELSVKAYAVLD